MRKNEQGRLDAVKRYLKLNDSISKDLTDIVNLAAMICETPMATVTLIDEQTQWLKATKGIDLVCTTREESLCQFTIEQDEFLIVEDALLDDRTKDLPAVASGMGIRFYAGANLTTHEGYNVGTLCVLDTKPRKLTATQQHTLKVLARQVINIMELSRSVEVLDIKHREALKQKQVTDNSQLQLRAIFDSSKDIFILIGKHIEVLSANKAAKQYILKVTGEELKEGTFLNDYLESFTLKKFIKFYTAAVTGHNAKSEFFVRRGTPHEGWLEISFVTVRDGDKILGVAINAVDITARKRHEQHIAIQNEALNRIATMQSHEIRKPVATLMGLVELIKMDSQVIDPDYSYLDMITATVNELNDKICGIVADSEVTLNTKMSDIPAFN